MRPFLPSPMDSLVWGWRCLARGYVVIAALSLTMVVPIFCPTHPSFDVPPTLWTRGAIEAWRGQAYFLSGDQAPRVDPATGIASLPGWYPMDGWNAAVLAVLRREGSVTPTFKDRIVDPVAIASAFDTDRGIDMGDGSRALRVGDHEISVEEYPRGGCGFGIPDPIQCGGQQFAGGRWFLRIVGPDGWRRASLDGSRSRGVSWVPHMTAVRARVSDDGRTLWLRGTDVESQRWIITADLVTATVIQIDADPAE